jgi:hypothetical protein
MGWCICARSGLAAGWGTALALLISHPGDAKATPPDSSLLALQAEYGTSLALAGNLAAAESVFVSMLSVSSRDPRALTNLGNLNLLRGELRTATVFYNEALHGDGADPGIRLDLAVALMMQGMKAEAAREAARALPGAGGASGALDLLGVRGSLAETQKSKAGEAPFLSEEELQEMLEAAARAIPADSSLVAGDSVRTARRAGADSSLGEGKASPDSAQAPAKEPPASRPGPPRKPLNRRPAGSVASEAGGTSRVLYWKH